MLRKVVGALVAIFVIFLIWSQPAAAADMVKSIVGFAGEVFERVVVFVRQLAR